MTHLFRIAMVLAVLLVFGGGESSAFATEVNTRKEALRIADEGAASYKAGNFAEALQKFDRAYNLYPAPPLLLNLSRTELKLGQCDAAIRYAQIYSADTAGGAGAANKSRASWLEHVKSECVEVEVTSTPPSVSLMIAGVPTASPAATPWRGRLLAGTYALTASAPGFENHAETLTVESGRPLRVTLQLTPALVSPEPEKSVVLPPPEPVASGAPTAPPPTRAIDLTPPVSPPEKAPLEAVVEPTPARSRTVVRNVGWAGIAVGGAALVSAIALGASSQGQKSLLTSTTVRTTAQADAEWAKEKSYATGSNALYVVGGVIAAAGLVVVIVF